VVLFAALFFTATLLLGTKVFKLPIPARAMPPRKQQEEA